MVGKQGELLKNIIEEYFSHVGLIMSNIYPKFRLYKILTKFPVLQKNSSYLSSYFKNNVRALMKVCE